MSINQTNENSIESIQKQIDNLFFNASENPITSSQIAELRKCFREATAKLNRLESPHPKTDIPVVLDVMWRWVNFRETVNAHVDLKNVLTKGETKVLMSIIQSSHAKNVDLNIHNIIELLLQFPLINYSDNVIGTTNKTISKVLPTLIPKLVNFANDELCKKRKK